MSRWLKGMIRYGLLLLFGSALTGCLGSGGVTSNPLSCEHGLTRADGRLQVRSQSVGGVSHLQLLDPSGMQPPATLQLPGEVTWLGWHPSNEILIVAAEIKPYSFGANYKVQLYRWNGRTQPSSRLLTDASLKPLTLARWQAGLTALPRPVLGPQGDVLAFLRLHDPPAFDPYLKLVLISLDGEGEMVLGSQAMPGAPLTFSADGESLSWTEGDGRIVDVHPWFGAVGLDHPHGEAMESVDPVLLQMRQLLFQGLLNRDDYRQQWLQRRQP